MSDVILRAALVSYPVVQGDKEANLRAHEEIVRGQVPAGVELFLFPELSTCGFPAGTRDSQDYLPLAEPVPEGASVQRLCRLAQECGTVVCAGVVEADGDRFYLTHFLCGPEGYIGKQRKILPGDPTKDSALSPGDNLEVLHLFGHRAAILACADWLSVESVYLAAVHQVSLILGPTDSFETNQEPLVRSVAAVRAHDCDASLLVAFGGSGSGSRAIAGLAAVVGEVSGEIVCYETRGSEETKVVHVEVPLRNVPPIWGGAPGRAPRLLRGLQRWQEGR